MRLSIDRQCEYLFDPGTFAFTEATGSDVEPLQVVQPQGLTCGILRFRGFAEPGVLLHQPVCMRGCIWVKGAGGFGVFE